MAGNVADKGSRGGGRGGGGDSLSGGLQSIEMGVGGVWGMRVWGYFISSGIVPHVVLRFILIS